MVARQFSSDQPTRPSQRTRINQFDRDTRTRKTAAKIHNNRKNTLDSLKKRCWVLSFFPRACGCHVARACSKRVPRSSVRTGAHRHDVRAGSPFGGFQLLSEHCSGPFACGSRGDARRVNAHRTAVHCADSRPSRGRQVVGGYCEVGMRLRSGSRRVRSAGRKHVFRRSDACVFCHLRWWCVREGALGAHALAAHGVTRDGENDEFVAGHLEPNLLPPQRSLARRVGLQRGSPLSVGRFARFSRCVV